MTPESSKLQRLQIPKAQRLLFLKVYGTYVLYCILPVLFLKEVERRKQLQQLILSGKIMLDKVIKLINVDKSCLESRSAGVN